MNIRVVDFEKVTKHFKTYRDGMLLIEIEKKFFLDSLKPFKDEVTKLVIENSTQMVTDRRFRDQKTEKFESIQKEILDLEKKYTEKVKSINDNITVKTFDELQIIISEWSEENNIDLVTSKMEIIFNSKKIDATEEIIDILKHKNLYVELTESDSDDSSQKVEILSEDTE